MSRQTVTIFASLPYLLRVSGTFPDPTGGRAFRVSPAAAAPDGPHPGSVREVPISQVGAGFVAADAPSDDDRVRAQTDQAIALVRMTNRLVRWYRAYADDPAVFEVRRAQLSPFRFVDADGMPWGEPFMFEPPAFRDAAGAAGGTDLAARVTAGFSSGGEPDVADLALADAATAFDAGRFREAVLLCWSAIDATFNRRFKQLVDERLASDWGDARSFLKGPDFGLRHKMTTGLRLLTGRSFYDLPNDFWNRLTESYRARNKIIHEGAAASEDESRRSIEVARELVRAVRAL